MPAILFLNNKDINVLLVKKKIEIERPINEVYDFATNMENFGSWFPEVIKIESHNNLDHGVVGKKYLETVKDPFKGEIQIVLEVKKADSCSSFVTEGDYPPLLPKMTIQFLETSKGSTELSWAMESRSKSFLIRISMIQLAKIIMRKRAKKGVLNLKNLLENGKIYRNRTPHC